MKLYEDTRAPNPRRVRMFLAEKNLEVPRVPVSIASKENVGDAHRVRHPLGLVPVLELDDGSFLYESMAICRYFEELHPEPNLFGRDALEKARIEQWNRLAELELLFPIAHAFRNTHVFWEGRIPQVPEFGKVSFELAKERLAFFDRELSTRPFLAGERFTVADITAFVALDFGRIVGVKPTEAHASLLRWREAIGARASAKA